MQIYLIDLPLTSCTYTMTVNKEVRGGTKVSVGIQGQKGEAAIYLVTC